MKGNGDNARIAREVGHPVARAIKAFGDENYAETVRLLRPIRNIAHRFGGSHAQRNVLDLTLIEAAARSGQKALAALSPPNERTQSRRVLSPASMSNGPLRWQNSPDRSLSRLAGRTRRTIIRLRRHDRQRCPRSKHHERCAPQTFRLGS
jgi:hypothetical protein